MDQLTTNQVLSLSKEQIWDKCDHKFRKRFGNFIREFNKREWSVRIGRTHESFEAYAQQEYPNSHLEEFGTGFVINGRPIPYFHPNRSFHDEIIWLNSNLYYRLDVTFENKLANSAIVKFYGPSRTLSIITGHADDLPYLTKTKTPYIDFGRIREDAVYEYTLMKNIELASFNKEQLWGTTELRTSLQIAARNYAREHPTIIDNRGVVDPRTGRQIIEPMSGSKDRKMRTSDMIAWIASLSQKWEAYYKLRPTMKQSYEFLTSYRGIGPYYGYHFSSNLARMPGVGAAPLIEKEFSTEFGLLSFQLGYQHGNLDEDADYVMAGPGATATLKNLWPEFSINTETAMKLIIVMRDDQQKYLDISSEMDYKYLSEATELGRFTTFGIEIGCCQFNVFTRLCSNPTAAAARANAPISKEVGKSSSSLESFFS